MRVPVATPPCSLKKYLNSTINSDRVLEDGTVEDFVVETYFHLAQRIDARRAKDGTVYVEVSFDDGGIDGVVRVPEKAWLSMATALREGKWITGSSGGEL